MVCRTISSVMICFAGSVRDCFCFIVAEGSVGFVTRFLNERVDWLDTVGPLAALLVRGMMLDIGYSIRWC